MTLAKFNSQLFHDCLARQIDVVSYDWLNEALASVKASSEFMLLANFSKISRYFTHAPLSITATESQFITALPKNWQLSQWTLCQTARALYLLTVASQKPAEFKPWLIKLLASADLQELIAVYQCLALLPEPASLLEQAQEGIRSNISAVFKAMAVNNPYPTYYFATDAWNQLVLKAIFIESELQNIIGLEQRVNPALSCMLLDYACERHAANRSISDMLWRLTGLGYDQKITQRLQSLTKIQGLRQGAELALTVNS
jgi:hypothetical protein